LFLVSSCGYVAEIEAFVFRRSDSDGWSGENRSAEVLQAF